MNLPPDLIDDLRLLEAPGPWWTSWWAWSLATAVLALIVFFGRRWLRGKGSDALRDKRALTPIPAEEDALAELHKLFAVIDEERSRHYGIEASAIVRRYIEGRFEIRAPLRATEEFLEEARRSPKLAGEWQELLRQFLGCCDFLKFARGRATRSELSELHRAAAKFVAETRRTRDQVGGGNDQSDKGSSTVKVAP